ncbi:hypothetical protein GGF42_001118 [Coemansia sp. RSA 2424]|nr:hypothetical protein GGF42_001118 [Coemansia sp. RSA 2424]
MTTPMQLEFRCLRTKDEVGAAYQLEAAGYSADEGASLDRMLYRYAHARHLFLGAFDTKTSHLVGYIMATQAAAPLVTHKSMGEHDPQGTTACVHSVCVGPQWQRKGVATKLLEKYIEMVREYNREAAFRIARLAMMAREDLVPLYQRAGYQCVGPSQVVHGSEQWFDCVLDL